jgi:single-stranded DNA-binding protein
MCTNETFRALKPDSSPGEYEERFRSDWHRVCAALPSVQETIKQVRKGDRVFVSGRLHYDFVKATGKTGGEDKFITSIMCDEILFLGRSRENQAKWEEEQQARQARFTNAN